MPRCEDYPCCGHGPPPHGDGGGCPDEEGRFNCVECGGKLPRGNSSSICDFCLSVAYQDACDDGNWQNEIDEGIIDEERG